jgi:hypothetical protein
MWDIYMGKGLAEKQSQPIKRRVMGWGKVCPSREPPSDWLRLFFEPNLFPYKYPTFPTPLILHTYSPMKMGQSVPKCWHLNYRCQ